MALTRSPAAQVGTKAPSAARRVAPLSRRAPLRVRAEVATEAPAAAAAVTKGGLEKSVPALKPALDIEAIKGILPHR